MKLEDSSRWMVCKNTRKYNNSYTKMVVEIIALVDWKICLEERAFSEK